MVPPERGAWGQEPHSSWELQQDGTLEEGIQIACFEKITCDFLIYLWEETILLFGMEMEKKKKGALGQGIVAVSSRSAWTTETLSSKKALMGLLVMERITTILLGFWKSEKK